MGLITTAGKFCYVQCDNLNCNRKMECMDRKALKDLAGLCGWENRGGRWTCPGCTEKADKRRDLKTRQRTLPADLKT